MDSALSFDGNTSENWRRFKQQYHIYLTASGSKKKDDSIKIATLLNFADEEPLKFSTHSSFPKAMIRSWTKSLNSYTST